MYSVDTTARFEKSVKECKRQGKRIDDLWGCGGYPHGGWLSA
jgi:hypothetical protein